MNDAMNDTSTKIKFYLSNRYVSSDLRLMFCTLKKMRAKQTFVLFISFNVRRSINYITKTTLLTTGFVRDK